MIQANAKCINNGKKLNETIGVLNNILKVVVSEEIEIVDSNNQPSKRWFFTGKLTGQKQGSDTGGKDRYGNTPSNNNRDQLTMGGMPLDNSGGNIAPPGNVTGGSGMLKWDGNKVIEGSGSNLGGVDQFGNTIGGSGGMLKWDGNKVVEGSGSNLGAADTTPPPLPGGAPLVGDTTPESTPRLPRKRTENQLASQEIIDAGQWVPQTGGMPNIQELGKIVEGGNASQYQKDFYDNAMANSLPTKDGKINLQAIRDNIEGGVATPYQQEFYDNAMANSLPIKDGKINLQAIRDNIEGGVATPYQQEFYNKALGIDSPAGAGAGAGAESRGDQQGISYTENGIEASVTEQGKNKPILNRDRRKTKNPTRRRKQTSPLIEAQFAVKRLEDKLFKAKKDDKLRYDWSKNMWVYKKFGDPDSALVVSLKSQLKSAKARVKRIQKK